MVHLRGRVVALARHLIEHAGGQQGIHFGGHGPHGTGGVHIVILHGGGQAMHFGGQQTQGGEQGE